MSEFCSHMLYTYTALDCMLIRLLLLEFNYAAMHLNKSEAVVLKTYFDVVE